LQFTHVQKFLGHKRLATTLTYTRAHDQTVAEDYYTDTNRIEKRLELVEQPIEVTDSIGVIGQTQFLSLVEQREKPSNTRFILMVTLSKGSEYIEV
jgi:hypothetical protein